MSAQNTTGGGMMTFLSLAPTTSASYPTAPQPKSPVETEMAMKQRRSSSEGSTGRRFLKLGPVHFGEGDGMGDWSEEVAVE